MKNQEAKKLADAARKLPPNAAELAKINGLYTAYIFRNRKKREIWTTCCGRHEIVHKQHAVMAAEHIGENRWKQPGRGCCGHSAWTRRQPAPEITPCPFCGADTYVKELGRTGKRDNLTAYRRAVVFRWHDGALWARAYYTVKRYGGDGNLTAPPTWQLHKAYRFQPGEAVCVALFRDGTIWETQIMTGRPKKLPLSIREPFPHSSAEGMGYTLFGEGEIQKSPFRYCQAEAFFKRSNSAMRFLAVCCVYPRQVEMLMKSGLWAAINDLAEGRKKNTAAFDWEEPDPLASFQLSKPEMRDFLAGGKDLDDLAVYKQFRRRHIPCAIAEIRIARENASYQKGKEVFKRLKARRIEPGRWNAYISREVSAENGKKKRNHTSRADVAQLWIDYIDAAEALGYDLDNPLMQMPKSIRKKHDAAVAAAAPVIAARRSAELSKKERIRHEQADARYAFELAGYVIRAPLDAGEIVEEGKALKHCVGGYADRHMNGKLTILFLRRAAAPHMPLVTIEMMGVNLVQIHGYQNDARAKVKPAEQYAAILDPWLAWVKAGSRRDEDGKPIQRTVNNEQRTTLPSLLVVNC